MGPVDPKFPIEGVAPHRPFFFSKWYKNLERFFVRFVTMHTFDRWTDRQTNRQSAFSSLDCICIACSTVKTTTRWTETIKKGSETRNKTTRRFLEQDFCKLAVLANAQEWSPGSHLRLKTRSLSLGPQGLVYIPANAETIMLKYWQLGKPAPAKI